MKLWHDDVRLPPEGWTWAKTNHEARVLFATEEITECSLDHDLGAVPTGETDPREVLYLRGDSRDGSGYDLVLWMIRHRFVPERVTIHSWNIVGAQNMAEALRDQDYRVDVRPYEIPTSGGAFTDPAGTSPAPHQSSPSPDQGDTDGPPYGRRLPSDRCTCQWENEGHGRQVRVSGTKECAYCRAGRIRQENEEAARRGDMTAKVGLNPPDRRHKP